MFIAPVYKQASVGSIGVPRAAKHMIIYNEKMEITHQDSEVFVILGPVSCPLSVNGLFIEGNTILTGWNQHTLLCTFSDRFSDRFSDIHSTLV